ncbi:MAG: type VI secretion system ATPase TssH, partial [Pseudomonadota bacterium]|nr:type VI secretion system ATPase TssH [Pseudomonadota bacterium]
QVIQELAGEDHYQSMKTAVMDIVGQHFRPEFINRVDDVVVFHPLGLDQIQAIAQLQIQLLRQRLHTAHLDLTVSDAALVHLGEAGFDPVYGARPLKRTIQQQLENPLAQALLAGEFQAGDNIAVDWLEDKLHFSKAAMASVA